MLKRISLLILAAFLFTSVSCTTVPDVPSPTFPVMKGEVAKFKKGFSIDKDFDPPVGTLTGNTWDMKNGTVEQTGGKCNNDEQGEKVVIWRDNLTIKNGRFAHWEDGVNLRARGVKFQNVIFENCEDALNMGEGCEDFTVTKCYFGPHPKKESSEQYKADKLIQAAITSGNNIIEDSKFWNAICAIRVGLKKYGSDKHTGVVVIRDNQFVKISTAIHEVRGKSKMSNNKFEHVKEEFKKE